MENSMKKKEEYIDLELNKNNAINDMFNPTVQQENMVKNKNEKDILINEKKGISNFITIEPIVLGTFFGMAMTDSVTVDIVERSICLQNFNMSFTECTTTSPQFIRNEVETMTANIMMIINLIKGICPVFLAFIVGPWSDTNGRKLFMLIPLKGYAIFYLIWGILVMFPTIPALYFIVPSILLSITGSTTIMMSCVQCYICDLFEESDRTYRFSVMDCANIIGSITGSLLAPFMTKQLPHYGYSVIFFICFIINIILIIYIYFFLDETIVKPKKDRKKVFDWENMKSLFVVFFKNPKKGKIVSILILVILLSEICITGGEKNIMYLVTKSQYSWNLEEFSIFTAINSVISALIPLSIIWIIGKHNISNATVLTISSMFLSIVAITKALSVNCKMFFTMQCLTSIFLPLMPPFIDTEISYIVKQEDLGKANGFITIIGSLSPILLQPLYTKCYQLLVPLKKPLYVFFPSAGAAFTIIVCSILLWVMSKIHWGKK